MRQGEQSHIYVHTDHSPDDVRIFYEVPDAIACRIQPEGDRRTFAQCLADMVGSDDDGES